MKTMIFGAGSDLGVNIDGTDLGARQLINDLKDFYKGESVMLQKDKAVIKSKDLANLRKNEHEIEKFNSNLYKNIVDRIEEKYFSILVGGDHSVAIASALASAKVNGDIGIIWIDAHTDYNTFETTVTGNIHGLPLAAINGYKNAELRSYHEGEVIQPAKTVIVGARSIDEAEKYNVQDSGVTVFTTEDIKEKGIEAIMDKAFKIAGYKTKGIHISYDLDIIDPDVAPGVSVPEVCGISENEAITINEYIIKHIDEVVSYDLVELNPLKDIDGKTEKIALKLLEQIIRAAEKKKEI